MWTSFKHSAFCRWQWQQGEILIENSLFSHGLVLGRRKGCPSCHAGYMLCPKLPLAPALFPFTSGWFNQRDPGDIFLLEWAEEEGMLCHLREGCMGFSQSWVISGTCLGVVRVLRGCRTSPANHCPCLLIYQRGNIGKEEILLLKGWHQPKTSMQRGHTVYLN